MAEINPAYLGEVMLLRWSDTHNGRTVTFQLESEAGEHPFRGYKCGEAHGQRLKLVAVLVGDDEEPISAKPADSGRQVAKVGAETKQSIPEGKRSFRDMPRSQQAAMKLQDDTFCLWLDGYSSNPDGVDNYDTLLKFILGITSKRELDTDHTAAARWDALLTDYDNKDYAR